MGARLSVFPAKSDASLFVTVIAGQLPKPVAWAMGFKISQVATVDNVRTLAETLLDVGS